MEFQNYHSRILAALTLVLVAVSFCGGTDPQKFQNVKNLTAHYTSGSLPSPRYRMAPVYDGNDTIYLFGGYGSAVYPISEIIRFDISNETVTLVNNLDTFTTIGHTAWDKDGNILFFAGEEKYVYKFEPATSAFYLWDYSPVNLIDYVTASYNSSVYFFGEYSPAGQVMTFDLDTFEYTTLASLPYKYGSLASTRLGNRVFLVGDQPSPTNTTTSDSEMSSGARMANNMLVYNLDDGTTSTGPDNFPTFPNNREQRMVNDGKNLYMIGTNNDTPKQGIIKIDPESLEWSFIYINGWPLANFEEFQRAPTNVYVEKLNRIYYFGGYITFGNPINAIWYVDLAELDETKN